MGLDNEYYDWTWIAKTVGPRQREPWLDLNFQIPKENYNILDSNRGNHVMIGLDEKYVGGPIST